MCSYMVNWDANFVSNLGMYIVWLINDSVKDDRYFSFSYVFIASFVSARKIWKFEKLTYDNLN
jgi:hypothetical protein